jgi:hypothetical protein
MTLPTDFYEAVVAWSALGNIQKAHGEPAARNIHAFLLRLQSSEPERLKAERDALDAVWGDATGNLDIRERVFEMSQQISDISRCWDKENLALAADELPLAARIVWLRLASQLDAVSREIREVMADSARSRGLDDVVNYMGPSTTVHASVVDGVNTGNQGRVI